MSSFYLASDKPSNDTGPEEYLKQCLNRVDQLHAEAARSRSEIIALRNSTLAELEKCAAVVRARSDMLLAQLDEIEIRRKADIETAIVAAEGIAIAAIADEEFKVDPAVIHVIESTQCFYAIESIDMPDWRTIRALQLFEFREFPVVDNNSVYVFPDFPDRIDIQIPDTVRAWGDVYARSRFLRSKIDLMLVSQEGNVLSTQFTYGMCSDSATEWWFMKHIKQIGTSCKNIRAVVYVNGTQIQTIMFPSTD